LTPVPASEPSALTVVELQRNAEVELERIRPVTDELGTLFADAGHELALVGGPVRDAMLGRPHTTSTSPPRRGPTTPSGC
jgi:poly(A) polymerase